MQRQNSVLRSVHVTSQWRLYPGGKLALSMAYPGGKLPRPSLMHSHSQHHLVATSTRQPRFGPHKLAARAREAVPGM